MSRSAAAAAAPPAEGSVKEEPEEDSSAAAPATEEAAVKEELSSSTIGKKVSSCLQRLAVLLFCMAKACLPHGISWVISDVQLYSV
ncbi:hypothetical protein SORBI_3010G133200 [Sorghum bicolor]|uniref:Uncharacterized protein n=1 Tax=Sorghum bicolor TaxID=4558 RepID=A0A194YIX8_SORBI|nr:hypothetical protein SORBI_3010G133200 [Sorghum bicolor]